MTMRLVSVNFDHEDLLLLNGIALTFSGCAQSGLRHVAGAGDGQLGADRPHPDAHAPHTSRTPR